MLNNIKYHPSKLIASLLLLLLFVTISCTQYTVTEKDGMVLIPAGTFDMGGDNEQARKDEFPKHSITLKSYWMDVTEVTNAQFQKFVDATHYKTTAEQDFEYQDQQGKTHVQKAGSLVFNTLQKGEEANPNTWWKFVEGANWKHPQGPNSSIEGKENFPVVQVSWLDAEAYCKWAGKRLPTEAEWEFAARGGLVKMNYAWGNEPAAKGKQKCNIWNGDFPFVNTLADKFDRSAPVKSFAPNKYGLYDVAGNVWEWCSDWYDADFYLKCVENSTFKNPKNKQANEWKEKVVRGGSFLCNDSYCSGFRVSARMQSNLETSLEHTGFRCVKEVE